MDVDAKENVEKVLIKLYREKKAECYRRVTEQSQMGPKYQSMHIPQTGYLRRLDVDIAWKVVPHVVDNSTRTSAL